MRRDLKSLGSWVTVRNIDPNVTDEEIQDFLLTKVGVDVPLANISHEAGKQLIVIAIPSYETAKLLHRAICDQTLRARVPRVIQGLESY
jgi:hypothetical protein